MSLGNVPIAAVEVGMTLPPLGSFKGSVRPDSL